MTNTNNKTPGQSTLPTPNSTASFWHLEPSEILLGHRTTPELPTVADVVVIGSGISGASAAHFLSEDAVGRSLNVVMLEAREACWGATGRVSIANPCCFYLLRIYVLMLILHRMEDIANRSSISPHQKLEPLNFGTITLSKP